MPSPKHISIEEVNESYRVLVVYDCPPVEMLSSTWVIHDAASELNPNLYDLVDVQFLVPSTNEFRSWSCALEFKVIQANDKIKVIVDDQLLAARWHVANPIAWILKANELIYAAQTLFTMGDLERKTHAGHHPYAPQPWRTARMLTSFAFENLFKAIIVYKQPRIVFEDKLEWVGSGHELFALSKSAEFQLTDLERNRLKYIESYAMITGRYPVSMKFARHSAEWFFTDDFSSEFQFYKELYDRVLAQAAPLAKLVHESVDTREAMDRQNMHAVIEIVNYDGREGRASVIKEMNLATKSNPVESPPKPNLRK